MEEIKQGYKQTDIGAIPEDWKEGKIRNFCSMKSGNSITSESISERGEFPCYGGNGLRGYTNKFTHSGKYTLVGRQGALCGNVNYVNSNFFASEHAIVTTPFSYSDALFLAYAFERMNLNQYTESSAQPGLSVNKVLELPFGCPPTLSEQTAIATALSDVDALIAALDKKITKKQQIKQGAMKQLLTAKTRLPGFKGEWVEKSIGEIIDYEQPTKYIVKSTEYIGNGIPVLTAGKTFILGFTDENENVYAETPVIIFDDFTTATKYVDFHFKVKSSAMKILKLKNEDYDFRLIFEIMQLINFPLSGHQRYWISEYRNILIKVPNTYEEQIAISQIITNMNDGISKLEADRNKYEQIKWGMMQQLLTGKIRLI